MHRAHIDNAPATAVLVHLAQTGPRREKSPVQMNGEKLFPSMELELVERGHGLDAGIRNQNVDFAEGGDSLGDAGFDLGFVGHIDGNPNRVFMSAELVGHCVRALLVLVSDCHTRAFAHEECCNFHADAARRSGDNGNFVIKKHNLFSCVAGFSADSRGRRCRDRGSGRR